MSKRKSLGSTEKAKTQTQHQVEPIPLSKSADELVTGSITKYGSSHIRWILVEVAQAIARTNKSRLKRFFRRVKA